MDRWAAPTTRAWDSVICWVCVNQFQKGKLLYVHNGVLYLFAFPGTNPVTIDKDGAFGGGQLAFSPNGQDVFHIKHRTGSPSSSVNDTPLMGVRDCGDSDAGAAQNGLRRFN